MRYIEDFQEELEVFRALGSEVRIQIIQVLLDRGQMSMNDLAESMHLSNGALTPHIRKLENSGLIRINAGASSHGNMKFCEPNPDKILFSFSHKERSENVFHSHLRAGQYSTCEVYPTCGLSTTESLIGTADDPRCFFHQNHFNADMLWFTKGYIEYMIPYVIPNEAHITQISISAELSSEAPGSNPIWPSDIHFYINHVLVGVWTSPGDFADTHGLFTPDWWYVNWNQYGLLKTLSVKKNGTYMDDQRISDVTIHQLGLSGHSPILLRMEVPETTLHVGGLSIFGRGFGNYNQDIEFRIVYETQTQR